MAAAEPLGDPAVAATTGTVEPVPRRATARHFLRPVPIVAAVVVLLGVLSAVAAPLLAGITGNDPYTYHPDALGPDTAPLGPLGGISAQHWFGVEPGTGRDLFSLVVYGARTSLLIGLAATVLATVIGVVLGIVAGVLRGAAERFVGFVTDVTLAFPFLIFAIALSAVFPLHAPRELLLIAIIGLFGWPPIARVVAAETRIVAQQPYVTASRVMGARFAHLFRHQILPNVAATIIVYAGISLPARIGTEATLSFLGVGVLPPTPSWGRAIGDAIAWIAVDPMFLAFPALALFAVTFAFTILADTLRDALDPRETA